MTTTIYIAVFFYEQQQQPCVLYFFKASFEFHYPLFPLKIDNEEGGGIKKNERNNSKNKDQHTVTRLNHILTKSTVFAINQSFMRQECLVLQPMQQKVNKQVHTNNI